MYKCECWLPNEDASSEPKVFMWLEFQCWWKKQCKAKIYWRFLLQHLNYVSVAFRAANSGRSGERLFTRAGKGWLLGEVSHYCSNVTQLSHRSSCERLGRVCHSAVRQHETELKAIPPEMKLPAWSKLQKMNSFKTTIPLLQLLNWIICLHSVNNATSSVSWCQNANLPPA